VNDLGDVNAPRLHTDDHCFRKIPVPLDQLLAKPAYGDIEKVGIED
jgi:hypothetical protein